MTEQDAIAADELKSFCQQLVHLGQLKTWRRFVTGSCIEVADNWLSMALCGLKPKTWDTDIMWYSIHRNAFPLRQPIHEKYDGLVFRIDTSGLHAGYARLIEERSGAELPNRIEIDGTFVEHGPALQYGKVARAKESLKMEFANDDVTFSHLVPLQDIVPAYHCPYWPDEASEWITRTRRHGCPSKSVIKQVVRYGCDFVGVAHKLSRNREKGNEWRFSFSMAEVLIIRSWTRSQRIVYRALRLLYKLISQSVADGHSETVLCTYYFKTLMLWACEGQPKEFWAERSLVNSIKHLMLEMAEWLKSKSCRNYFIRDNNMMDHLVNTDVSLDVSALAMTCTFADYTTHALKVCAKDETDRDNIMLRAELPCWVYRASLVLDRTFNSIDFHYDLYNRSYSFDLWAALIAELSPIYHGLACQVKSATSRSKSDRLSFSRLAKSHFETACDLYKSAERISVSIPSTGQPAIRDVISSYFGALGTVQEDAASQRSKILVYTRAANRRSECNDELSTSEGDSRDINLSKSASFVRSLGYSYDTRQIDKMAASLAIYQTVTVGATFDRTLQFYKELPGLSPSVNASWFIAKAYLANLYYQQRRYKAVCKVCGEMVERSKYSLANHAIAEVALPVSLSVQWTAVYDAELQALLGLCSLCAFVSNRTDSRSVCLAVCPVQFVLYLKLRCALDQQVWDDASRLNVPRYASEFEEHVDLCNFGPSELKPNILFTLLSIMSTSLLRCLDTD